MKKNLFLLLVPIFVLVSSCGLQDDIDELKDRLDNVEDVLGTNSPIEFSFETTNYNEESIAIAGKYQIKAEDGESVSGLFLNASNNEAFAQVVRFSDVGQRFAAYVWFQYNSSTKEFSNWYVELRTKDPKGNYYTYFEDGIAGNTFTVEVAKVNTNTGEVEFELTNSTTAAANNNTFEGIPMNISINFKGKLEIFDYQDERANVSRPSILPTL